jgi:hypothetical protein
MDVKFDIVGGELKSQAENVEDLNFLDFSINRFNNSSGSLVRRSSYASSTSRARVIRDSSEMIALEIESRAEEFEQKRK